jgi:multicomponent K+:H+ antiporter subunit D
VTALWIAAPIAWPMLAGALLLLTEGSGLRWQRALAISAAGVGVIWAIALLHLADSGVSTWSLMGNWPARIGIVLLLDRLSALMLLLTAILGLVALIYACNGEDRSSRHFHALLQFQLMGLNGAFLSGDLFNLFVWFEVLLIASYGLLLHGGGAARLRAGMGYVIFNLAGSALFLVALALIYGIAGTLNMADLAQILAHLPESQHSLMRSALALLLLVFGIKAALLPLYFWLPGAYSAAAGSVAALFAVLTKVGLYCLLRVGTQMLGPAGSFADLVWSILLPGAILTLGLGALGALAARDLGRLSAQLVIVSAGTAMLAFALQRADSIAAGLSYLLQSTFATALLFLLTDLLRRFRQGADQLRGGAALEHATAISLLLFAALIMLAGLPPSPGFLTKALLIAASFGHPAQGIVVTALLLASLLTLLALVRAFTQIAWNRAEPEHPIDSGTAAVGLWLAPTLLLALLTALSVYAAPLQRYAQATAEQLLHLPQLPAPAPLPRPEIAP